MHEWYPPSSDYTVLGFCRTQCNSGIYPALNFLEVKIILKKCKENI